MNIHSFLAFTKIVQKEVKLVRITVAVIRDALAIVHFPEHFMGALRTVSMRWLSAAAQCILRLGKGILAFNSVVQSRALPWWVIAMCPTHGEGNQRRQVTRKRVYFFFLLPEREVGKITVSAKGKYIYMWKEKQIRKHIGLLLGQTLLSITRLPLWPRHVIYAWYITYTSWYIKYITRSPSNAELMLVPSPNPGITGEDGIHYTSMRIWHWPRTLFLSPSRHYHIEFLPWSPFELAPNSQFSHVALNHKHQHPGAHAVITILSITASSILASQQAEGLVHPTQIKLVAPVIQSGAFKGKERNFGMFSLEGSLKLVALFQQYL